jgi:hypothetical protein
MKLIMENFRKFVKEAYYGSVPGEPETPAGYGGALDLAKLQQQLADHIEDLVRLGKLNPEDLSIETVRANQEIPWDRYQPIDDEDLEWILSRQIKKNKGLREAITLDIEIGDIVLGGKYKNKRVEVKEIGTDDIGQPTINGKTLLKFRIEKQLPDGKKSKKTLDAEKEETKEK